MIPPVISIPEFKRCTRCGEEKRASDFTVKTRGNLYYLNNLCKDCAALATMDKKQRLPYKRRIIFDFKKCPICLIEKSKNEFYKLGGRLSGPCKDCLSEKRKRTYKEKLIARVLFNQKLYQQKFIEAGIRAPGTEEFLTPDRMFNLMGICICPTCGKLCSIDYKWCSKCEQPVIVLLESKFYSKQELKISA